MATRWIWKIVFIGTGANDFYDVVSPKDFPTPARALYALREILRHGGDNPEVWGISADNEIFETVVVPVGGNSR